VSQKIKKVDHCRTLKPSSSNQLWILITMPRLNLALGPWLNS
jgi:hypothetical protein